MPKLAISLFGPLHVTLDGTPVTEFKTNKVQALLAYLAVEADRAHERESLAGLLWADQPEEAARVNLRASLHRLRQAIHAAEESSFLLLTRETVQFNLESDHALDVRTFLALLQACAEHQHDRVETCPLCHERLKQAAALYRGDFLAGLTLSDSVAFDEWVVVKREMLRRKALDALTGLAAFHERRGEYESAQRYALRQIELEPWRELAYRQLMRALALNGQRTEALTHYDQCREVLAKELGVEPEAETVALVVQIRTGPLTPAHELPPGNLPVPLTRFIGREQEMAEVKQLLATTHLLTLTGPGGVGKTRLALQVAAEVSGDYADGVWLVELAALAQPPQAPQAVATALNMCEESQRPLLATLSDCLRDKQLLLVLDNCEHLIQACAELADRLLRVAPRLRILATSRESLHITGERVYQALPLRVPDIAAANRMTLAELTQYESVRLFMDRAASVQSNLTITSAAASAVAQICYHLDGIPLAIELAAARVNVLPIEQIAMRLDERFRLLTGGSRTALPRQQTLLALIDWSYDWLSPAEQALFNRLSVFRGGCALEAMETVCACKQVQHAEIVQVLTQLAEKSLIRMDERSGEPRYLMLETVRQYGQDKLKALGEAENMHRLHSEYFLRLAKEAEAQLSGAAQQAWLARLELEHDNLRMALEWSLNHEPGIGLQLAGALGPFWDVRGYFTEGLETLECALSGAGDEQKLWQAKALHWAGKLAARQGDYERAQELETRSLELHRELGHQAGIAHSLDGLGQLAWFQSDYATAWRHYWASLSVQRELADPRGIATALNSLGQLARAQDDYAAARRLYQESLSISQEIADPRGMAFSLNGLGVIAWAKGDDATAQRLLEEALSLQRQVGDRPGLAHSLNNLGKVAWARGDYDTAQCLYEESLVIERELGDKPGSAYSLHYLGSLARVQGDYTVARALDEESLAIRRGIGNPWGIAESLISLGKTALAQGDYAVARDHYAAGLNIMQEIVDKQGLAECLEGFAGIASGQGNAERSTRLYAAAQVLRQKVGVSPVSVERAEVERDVAAACARLGKAAFEAAWTEGGAMTLEQAIALASAEPEALRKEEALAPSLSRLQAAKEQFDGLTARERQVAALVAQGKSNREIADALVVSGRTAAAHVSNILSKLEFTSRTQIATWAIAKGLVAPPTHQSLSER